MEWAQILALFLANASLIVWFRSESRADFRALDSKIDANRAETHAMINGIHNEIRADMRDFHGRLCALEERRIRRDEEAHPW